MDKKSNKEKTNSSKKKLIRTHRDIARVRMIVTVVLLLAVIAIYYLIDSGSYVATVDGHRISNAEYSYFLSRQLYDTEIKNELTTKEEKDKFWMTPADGQDPYELAKSNALEFSKKFMIQLIKAQEMGLKIDTSDKNDAASYMQSIQGDISDKQFSDWIRATYKVSRTQFQKIYEKLSLIGRFKSNYLKENYTPVEFSEDDLKTEYDANSKIYDSVDISYVSFYKFDETGNPLTQDQIDAKMDKAKEALNKIDQGEDIDKIIAEYSDEKAAEDGEEADNKVGKATLKYDQSIVYQYFVQWDLVEWAFENKPGDTGIVDAEHIIYVARIEDRTEFEDVKAAVKTYLENKSKEDFYNNALESWGMESRYNIIKNDRVYDSISYK